MKIGVIFLISAFAMLTRLSGAAGAEVSVVKDASFFGSCDASAGVAIDDDLFAVADDEVNTLRVFRFSKPGGAVSSLNLDVFLQVQKNSPEADIEGAARIGDIVYWTGSHGRNKNGKERDNRERFFATRLTTNAPYLHPFGIPYRNLEDDLLAEPAFAPFKFAEASRLAPKEKGALNIEGLAAGPDGSVWIGFRNPIHKRKAILISLLNPSELVSEKPAKARFGRAVLLSLGGKGIRDMVWDGSEYYLIGGSYHGGGSSEIFRWDGKGAKPEMIYRWKAHELNPEAIFTLPHLENKLVVLSDQGAMKTDGVPCKEMPKSSRHFRGLKLQLN
jgi:hypothetical protein